MSPKPGANDPVVPDIRKPMSTIFYDHKFHNVTKFLDLVTLGKIER